MVINNYHFQQERVPIPPRWPKGRQQAYLARTPGGLQGGGEVVLGQVESGFRIA
jgi:hypothetical protein